MHYPIVPWIGGKRRLAGTATASRRASMTTTDRACYFYRDADGFCLLTNRCWSGKPCPRTQRQADRAREELIDEIIKERDER